MLEDRLALQRRCFAEHERKQAFAVEDLARLGGTGEFEECREEIDVRRRRAERGARGDLAGPTDDEGYADTAFIEAAFAATERGVVGDAPAVLVVRSFRLLVFAFCARFTDQAVGPVVAADAAVIAREDEHRIVRELKLLELGHHAAHALVHARDHRRVHRTIMPADAGLALELCDQLGLGVKGGVHAEVREVEQERFVLITPDEIDGFIGQPIRQIGVGRILRRRIHHEFIVLAHGHEGLVEASLGWMLGPGFADVPLPEQARRVTGLLELVGERVPVQRELRDVIDRAERTLRPIEAVGASDRIDPRAGAVLAAQQRRAGRRAVLTVVVVGQAHPLRGEPVDIGRLVILAPEGAKIGPSEVVG